MEQVAADPPEPEMLAALKRRLGPGRDVLPLPEFIDCALYQPGIGYYRRPERRVGRDDRSDFYTAESLGEVFARLVVAAAIRLLGVDPGGYSFVEFGPESADGLLALVPDHPFAESRLIRPDEGAGIPPRAIVFSNELFDAQPFRRFIRQENTWREMGVRIGDRGLDWDILPETADLPELPADPPEGYCIDWPSGAHDLMRRICRQDWQGLFLAFDYGLDRSTIFTERPRGTARTYAGHTMGTDLLEHPGRIDITCHLVWDELEAIARRTGFPNPRLERQEAFFMTHARSAVQNLLESAPAGFSRRKQTLMELLNPGNMGHKFQVLSARR